MFEWDEVARRLRQEKDTTSSGALHSRHHEWRTMLLECSSSLHFLMVCAMEIGIHIFIYFCNGNRHPLFTQLPSTEASCLSPSAHACERTNSLQWDGETQASA